MKFFVLIFFTLLFSCSKNKHIKNSKGSISYLALGDSYTIGESVKQDESFPYQLASVLRTDSINLTTPKIIARTGWTTEELQVAINSENIQQKFDIVTLLIGVNNQYRGYSQGQYRTEFKVLLQQAVSFAGGNKKHVFVISIPDWAVTPFGKNSGRNTATISAEIDAFNEINREESLTFGVNYIDITPGSRKADNDKTLIAPDGLHPSGKMYREWAELIALSVKESLMAN